MQEPTQSGSQARDTGNSDHSKIEQGLAPLPHAGQSLSDSYVGPVRIKLPTTW